MNSVATSEAIKRVFQARSVALVGASTDPKKYGYMTLDTLIKGGFDGKIYPVNPKGGEILGRTVYRSLEAIPEVPDMVVVLVPVQAVPGVLREAGSVGVPAAVVTSAGFSEVGRTDLQDELGAVARECGIRLMGPNIAGVAYLPNQLCALFFPAFTVPGPLAIVSQSGSLTNGLAEWASEEGLGICAAVNLGNQVDLSEADFLEYFTTDPNVGASICYLEGVKDGRRFLETLRRVGHEKPIAILKSGRSSAGRRSAASHTSSLAGTHEVFQAACRQCGVIAVSDLTTLYDCGKALATLGRPAGNRVLAISTSGGIGTLAVDEAESLGLSVPLLPEGLVQELKGLGLSPLASLSNPIDLAAIWAEEVREVALRADRHDVADVFLINFGDPVEGAAEAVKHVAANVKAKVAVSYLGGGEEEKAARWELHRAGIPVYPSPERAMVGISAVVEASHRRRMRLAA